MVDRRYVKTSTHAVGVGRRFALPPLLHVAALAIIIATTLGVARVGYGQDSTSDDGYSIAVGNETNNLKAVHLSTTLSYVDIVLEEVKGRHSYNGTFYSSLEDQREGFVYADEMPLISIVQFDIALKVENLKPSGVKSKFSIPQGEKSITLYAFSDVQTAIYPTAILHVWTYKGRVAAEIPLKVASSSWRTYSSKIIEKDEVGNWSVYIYHIKDPTGLDDTRSSPLATHSLFDYYYDYDSVRNGSGSRAGVGATGENGILSQEVSVATKPTKPATLLGIYSFVVEQ